MNRSIEARIAARYILLIRLGRMLSGLPLRFAYFVAGLVTRRISPLRHLRPDFESYVESASIPIEARARVWHETLAQQGLLFVNNALHRNRHRSIIDRLAEPPPSWQQFVASSSGALILTMHHDFHHTLFMLTGAHGKRVHVIAAPEDSGPLAQWLTPYIRQQHADCAVHFNGGEYIFTEHSDAWKIARALKRGDVVFSLHDFDSPGKNATEARIFDRSYEVAAGSIRIALRLNVPVYFAVLVWSSTNACYTLVFHPLEVSSEQPLEAYTEQIEQLVRQYPTAWHGWQWLGRFRKVN